MKTMIWLAKVIFLVMGIFGMISNMLHVETLLMVYGPATVILGTLVSMFLIGAFAQDVFSEVES